MKTFFTKCVKGYQCLDLHVGGIWVDAWKNEFNLRFWPRDRLGFWKRLTTNLTPSEMIQSHFALSHPTLHEFL